MKEYIEKVYERWLPVFNAGNTKKLPIKQKKVLACLLENTQREIEKVYENELGNGDKLGCIFIPLTTKLFSKLMNEYKQIIPLHGPVGFVKVNNIKHIVESKSYKIKFTIPEDIMDNQLVDFLIDDIYNCIKKECKSSVFIPYVLVSGRTLNNIYIRFAIL